MGECRRITVSLSVNISRGAQFLLNGSTNIDEALHSRSIRPEDMFNER